jgi:hypothetical protein
MASDSEATKQGTRRFDPNWLANLERIRDQLKKNKFSFTGVRGVALPKGKNNAQRRRWLLRRSLYPHCSRLVPYPPGFDRTVIAQETADFSHFRDVLGRPRENKWCQENTPIGHPRN